MLPPRRLILIWAFTAYYRDSFAFFTVLNTGILFLLEYACNVLELPLVNLLLDLASDLKNALGSVKLIYMC
jgi:hypothetical protein